MREKNNRVTKTTIWSGKRMKVKAEIYAGSTLIRRHAITLFSQLWITALTAFVIGAAAAHAQANSVGQKPYLGWSTFSEQTINGSFLTQANIQAQSDALAASGIQKHGSKYINIDSGWMSTFDANGRPIPAAPNFPDIKALIDHIHANGQKAGIYWIP